MDKIGRYTITEQIGKGGMGIVYRALDTVLQREVALKTHTVGPEPDAQSIERFFREARVIASFKHRNVVTVFDLGRDRDKVFIAMELLEGQDLTGVLAAGAYVSLEEKLRIVEGVSQGLAHAHDRGIVHRDIKPRNVFVTHDGEIKLLDFGLAHIAYSTLTEAGQIIGTPFYMSPEQVLGEKANPRSDIFSLGTLFYELLTGERAFGRPSLDQIFDAIVNEDPSPVREIDPAIPVELARIVGKMMHKSADRRYASVDELLRDLSRFQSFLRQCKSQLRNETLDLLNELGSVARRHPKIVDEHEVTIPPPELPDTLQREDVSYMSLVGLRDGTNLQLRRLELLVDDFPESGEAEDESDATMTVYERPSSTAGDARERARRDEQAEQRYQSARAHYGRGDLAASLRLVNDSLRLNPNHAGSGNLAEEVRTSIARLANNATGGDQPKHFDVLVAALLAVGPPGGERAILGGDASHERSEIAGLSDFLLSGLPKDKAELED